MTSAITSALSGRARVCAHSLLNNVLNKSSTSNKFISVGHDDTDFDYYLTETKCNISQLVARRGLTELHKSVTCSEQLTLQIKLRLQKNINPARTVEGLQPFHWMLCRRSRGIITVYTYDYCICIACTLLGNKFSRYYQRTIKLRQSYLIQP